MRSMSDAEAAMLQQQLMLVVVMEKASAHHLALIGRRRCLVSREWPHNDVSGALRQLRHAIVSVVSRFSYCSWNVGTEIDYD